MSHRVPSLQLMSGGAHLGTPTAQGQLHRNKAGVTTSPAAVATSALAPRSHGWWVSELPLSQGQLIPKLPARARGPCPLPTLHCPASWAPWKMALALPASLRVTLRSRWQAGGHQVLLSHGQPEPYLVWGEGRALSHHSTGDGAGDWMQAAPPGPQCTWH